MLQVPEEVGALKFSLSTGMLYPYPLRWVFRWAREAGYHGVELLVNPEAIARGGAGARRMADEEGVEIFSVHPSVIPLPGWREHRDGLKPTILLAEEAGAGMVVMHTPHFCSLDDEDGQAFQRWIESWQTRLAGGGLRLTMENKAVRRDVDQAYALTPLEALRAFADRHDLGLVLDTTHARTAGEDLLQARQTYNGRLANVHLSDMGGRYPLSSNARARQWLGEHRLPGAGDLPLAELLLTLAREGYDGPVTLEASPFDLHAWWPPAVRRRLAATMDWLKEATGN
jgi:sugar phosphate isomerase/epimerase